MDKTISLFGATPNESYDAFRQRILAVADAMVHQLQPKKAWVTLTVAPPPRLSVIPFRRKKIAALSLILQEGASEAAVPLLSGFGGFRAAVRVTEALPVSYNKSWKNGTVTPGICLLTLFRARRDISRELFLDRWHNSHTPLSLRIHPLWHYNRNVVEQTLASGEADWGGIVEEHFRSRSDLLNPFLFFGNPLVILPHMIEVLRDTRSFIDYPSMENYLVSEYHVV